MYPTYYTATYFKKISNKNYFMYLRMILVLLHSTINGRTVDQHLICTSTATVTSNRNKLYEDKLKNRNGEENTKNCIFYIIFV